MDIQSFLPPLILERDREKPWMEWVPGTVLFADVSGFTPMSEALAVLGAEGGEILTDVLNRYFAAMIGVIHTHGGQVMKFGGDAILCFFPEVAKREKRNDKRKVEGGTRNSKLETRNTETSSLSAALRAAHLMQDAMPRFQNIKTPVKKFALKMKIGVAHGDCLLAGVGDTAVRCDYVFAGAPVDATSDAEHHAVAGEIVFAGDEFKVQSSKLKVEAVKPGFWRVSSLQSSAFSLQLEPAQPSAFSSQPSAWRSYLIAEVHDLVLSGHSSQVGALLEIVPVFLKFTGFNYTRDGFDLPLFDAFFRTVMEITERHGGRLNRISMGDKGSTALLLFGAPNPMEKKEQLASQWALDLFAAVRARFPRLTVGAGMNSGRVFTGIVGGAGRWEYTVMGDAVNFAARLMQGAETGQACASEAFAQRAKEVYGFDDLGTRKFKGKSEPLAVHALKERRRAGWTAGGTEQSVGRERETRTLLERLERAWNGEPGMAVIEGEPGVGKSFFAARLLQEAHRKGWRTIPAKGEITLRNHAYAPWRQVASDLLFQGRKPSATALARSLDEEQTPFLAWFCEFLDVPIPDGTPRPAHDEETRKRLFQHQLSRLLINVAAGFSLCDEILSSNEILRSDPKMETTAAQDGAPAPTPNSELRTDADGLSSVCIFLDDLHWFDTLSLEFLATLLNHLKNQRLFILAATRPEWEKKDFENRAMITLLALADLDRDGCRTLAEARLGGKIRDVLTDFLYERTKGNPFFTHQLLDFLLHEDLLETRLGEWLLKRGVEQKGAMTGTEVLLAQVSRLPAVEQAHLQAAACMGPTFSYQVMKAVLGRSFRTKAVNALIGSGYLFARDELQTPNSELRTLSFPHALVQETIYQAMPQRTRKRNHRKIGLCMESLFSHDLIKYYPNLANHYFLAGMRDKAIKYCSLAGGDLYQKLSFPESLQYYEKAFGLARFSGTDEKLSLGLRLAQAQIKTGRFTECLGLTNRLRESARRGGDISAAHRLSAMHFDALEKLGQYGYIAKALGLLKGHEIHQSEVRTEIMHLAAIGLFRLGKFDKADEWFLRIIQSPESPGAVEYHLSSLVYLASIESKRGNVDRALAYLEQGLDRAAKAGNTYQEIRLRHEYAAVLMDNKKFDEARGRMAELLPMVEGYGDYYLTAVIWLNSGLIDIWMNHWPDAARELEEAARIFSSLGVLNGYAKSRMNLGILAFYRNEFQKAYDFYLNGTTALEKAGELTEVCHGYYNLCEACVRLKRKEEAYQWYRKGLKSFNKEDSPSLFQMYQELEPMIAQL